MIPRRAMVVQTPHAKNVVRATHGRDAALPSGGTPLRPRIPASQREASLGRLAESDLTQVGPERGAGTRQEWNT